MDSFIKVVEQKKEEPIATIHTQQIEQLRKYIRAGKNVFICGATGVGKSYILQSVLNDANSHEIQKEHLKSKSLFLTFIKGAAKHTFIEDYDSDFKPLVERVSDGERLTRGSLVVTSINMCMFPNFGNIRDFFSYLEGSDDKDVFKTPKEFITDLLTNRKSIGIPSTIHEHGHVWDIFQENYVDSKGVDIQCCAHGFSEADIYDTYMYTTGDWNMMPYFVLSAVIIPRLSLGKTLNKDTIRPGSCWTKYGNFRMRSQKYHEIHNRTQLYIDDLCVLKKYAEHGDIQPMLDYGLTPQDFDVINHLAVGSKLKQRDVTRVKKAIQNGSSQGKSHS
jgi:energy-coupling factor transporter ATP-binding protein EcfA2